MSENSRHPIWAAAMISVVGVALALILAAVGPSSAGTMTSATAPGQPAAVVAGAPQAPGGTTGAPMGGSVQQASIQSLDIRVGDYFYEPTGSVVQAGQVRVTLENVGARRHALIVQNPTTGAEIFSLERINRGETAVVEFSLPAGSYRLYCPITDHADRGQVGTLTAA